MWLKQTPSRINESDSALTQEPRCQLAMSGTDRAFGAPSFPFASQSLGSTLLSIQRKHTHTIQNSQLKLDMKLGKSEYMTCLPNRPISDPPLDPFTGC